MSMLSAQCDELRALAESVGLAMPQAATLMMGAADAIDGLESENAKLRELSSIMLKCIIAEKNKIIICWECPMHKQFDELRSYCCLKHEAKELGVEVGE